MIIASQKERLYLANSPEARSITVQSGTAVCHTRRNLPISPQALRLGITVRGKFAASPKKFTSDLPEQDSINQRVKQLSGDIAFCRVARIVSIDQDVGVNGVHAFLLA